MSIKCQVCQKEFRTQITNTHIRTHNLTTLDYKSRFGMDSLTIQEYRYAKVLQTSGENNPNFKGDQGKERHVLYHGWGMHRRNGCAPEWEDFWQFVRDVGSRPTESHRLRRKERSNPIGPSNFEWYETVSNKNQAEYMREWGKRNPDKVRQHATLRRYGMTSEQYNQLHVAQDGKCSICRQPETIIHKNGTKRSLAVDHCHKTKKVRELLCQKCNMMLGDARENISILQAAIDYLKKHEES